MENVSTAPNGDILLDLAAENLYEDATVGQRFANFVMDIIVFYLIVNVFTAIVYVVAQLRGVYLPFFHEEQGFFVNWLYGAVLMVTVYTLIEGATKGRSLGKYVTKTKVIKDDGAKLVFKDFLMRSLCRVVPFEVFSAFGGYPWHDKWTNTRVVKKNKFIS